MPMTVELMKMRHVFFREARAVLRVTALKQGAAVFLLPNLPIQILLRSIMALRPEIYEQCESLVRCLRD